VRVVLDTNVLISSFIARGVSHKVFEHCLRQHTLVTSQFILDELRKNLVKKFKYQTDVVDEAIELLRSQMEVVVPTPLDTPICRDADDDNVLATAIAGNCDCIVTGDKDLLALQRFQTIDIISPADFYQKEVAKER